MAWQHGLLHIDRQGRAYAVGVDQMRIQTFRFEKYLVPVAIAETMDLIFDGWTIARTFGRDCTREKRRPIEIGANDIVSSRGGTGYAARDRSVGA